MSTSSNSNARPPRGKKAGAHGESLDEEIVRIQGLLHKLDESLAKENEISLKDLAVAVHTAGDGGKSIAQLRKFAQELVVAIKDEDYEKKRASLLAALEKLGQWQDEE